MRVARDPQNGVVAILDALGAADYSDAEIRRFMRSRENVLELLTQKAGDVLGDIRADMITTFTFNDTVLIILTTGAREAALENISSFFTILRKFFVDSLAHQILFRGSIAIGNYYVNEDTNTVMGQAVTDAAAWYDKADWIGIHATPRSTLLIQRHLEADGGSRSSVMLDYQVPLTNGSSVRAKTLNWPKAFFVPSISPCAAGESPREKLLEFLTAGRVPAGTEQKFFNALSFFDFAAAQIKHTESQLTGGSRGRRRASRR